MNTINGLSNIPLAPVPPDANNAISKTSKDFGDILKAMLEEVNETQLAGEEAVKNLQSGKAKHLHEVMIAVEEADISLRMLVQMRNRALTSYEELMRMQL